MSIELTESAAQEVKQICDKEKLDPQNVYLRVGVKGGGCSGFNYLLDLTEDSSEDDWQFDQHGVRLVCDQKSYLYLQGVSIDFKREMMASGFVFKNPNANNTCGCGASFAV
ncbi:MAG: iron-sulfur cluster insertion protein ErpA [Phycisphaeraceae bacterium]|nr:iron-sulfur cluster insertion protein ErpA [Phycisphaeraceae bacterium]